MVQKLSIQLKLEGDAEIKRQLEGIDDAGKKLFNSLIREAKKVGGFQNIDFDTITKKAEQLGVKGPEAINKVTEAVKAAGKFEQLVSGLKLVETALNRTGIAGKALVVALGPLNAIVAILAIAFGVALVGGLIKASQAIAAIDAQAIKLGSTFEAFSKAREGLLRAGVGADNIAQGFEHLQNVIDKLTMERVEKAITDAQKNIAAGWPPTTEQLERLRTVANGVGPAAEAARRGLEALGQPLVDRVTPALEGMIRSAGSAAAAIPQIAGELARMGTAGERVRLISGLLDAIALESGGAVQGMRPLLQVLEQMPPGIERNAQAVRLFGQAMGAQIAQLLNLGTSISDIIAKSEGMAQSQADAANRIVQAFNQMKGALTGFDQLWGAIASSGTAALGKINGAMDTLIGKLQDAIRLMQQLPAGGGGGGSTARGFAHGGIIGGTGSGTSDSNLAWVSRGEHIMPAGAVRQPGVMAFLEALRRTGGDLRGVLGHIPRFAEGGPVGMSHVTIAFPGMPPVGGLRASGSVVDELRRSAALAQVRSGGRKPTRYT